MSKRTKTMNESVKFPFTACQIQGIAAAGYNAFRSTHEEYSRVCAEIYFREARARVVKALGGNPPKIAVPAHLKNRQRSLASKVAYLNTLTNEFHTLVVSKICNACKGYSTKRYPLNDGLGGIKHLPCNDCNATGFQW